MPYGIALYKASNDKIEEKGFSKFSLSPFDTLDKLEKMNTQKRNISLQNKCSKRNGSFILFKHNIL